MIASNESPERRSGDSRLLRLITLLCYGSGGGREEGGERDRG